MNEINLITKNLKYYVIWSWFDKRETVVITNNENIFLHTFFLLSNQLK